MGDVMKTMLVFPHQLYVQPRTNTRYLFIEDSHFFDRGIPFHKHKLVLHRASMKALYHSFEADKAYFSYPVDKKALDAALKSASLIEAYDPVDHALTLSYDDYPITWLPSPNFLTAEDTFTDFFRSHKRYYMHDFYRFQRKRLGLLIDGDRPTGGKWSFDQDNRQALPEGIAIPPPLCFDQNPYLEEAKRFVDRHFPTHPGDTDTFNYPTTRAEAKQQLRFFLDHKFKRFGAYQDALSQGDAYLFHSNISSSLNTGLLAPDEVVQAALERDVPIASKEGFLRQIIGWREFIRALYVLEGPTMRLQNHLNHHARLSHHWYHGAIGIPIVDSTLAKLKRHAYAHHIERLMVLGNAMLLLNVHPDDVYRFFMAMHIDAYDWVMVPNIYGMSQFAAGPLMTTKPYFSGANYLRKMGVLGGDWEETWDALFYLFLKRHRAIINANPRLRMLLRHLDRKPKETLENYQTLRTLIHKKTLKEEENVCR